MAIGRPGPRVESRYDVSVTRRAEEIRDVPAFSQLNDDERLEVALALREKRAKKDGFVFHEGAQATALFIVKSGKVKVFKTATDGKEQILGIFDRGDVFGAAPIFSGGKYPASAVAITPSEIYAFQKQDCLYLAQKYPKLTLGAMQVMTDRLKKAHELARDLASQTVAQRTAGLLVRLAGEFGVQSGDGIRIDLALSRDDLAEMVGTSRETFIRALSRLAREGIISLVKRSIIIVDKQALLDRSET
ncbi:MAG: Crp/Fnr family transcriptional regulator [Dehalococcoidia bacterium]|nr:Crp/Fnr family transcriptional regulator [Dehalococcoidia bacterium]